MSAPEASTAAAVPAGQLPGDQHQQQQHSQHPHHQPQHQLPHHSQQGPAYPSLAYPSAGPSHSQPQHQQHQHQHHQHQHQHQPPPPPPPHFQPQQQQWYNPYYQYPPGPGRPQPNGGFQPGYNPYGGGGGFPYQHQQQFYPQQFGHPMPGPGPNTMQNGYYNQGYPRPYYDGSVGSESDDHAQQQQQQQQQPGGAGFQQHMGFQQPYYPPGHPYAYGVGVGYQQQMPYPGSGGGGGYRGGDQQSQPQHHHQPQHHPPSKGLNPAAAGFNYVPPVRKEPPVANGSMPNGSAAEAKPAPTVPPAEPASSSLGLSLQPATEPPQQEEPSRQEETKQGTQTDEAQQAPPAPASAKAEAVAEPTPKQQPVDLVQPEPVRAPANSTTLVFTGAALDGTAAPSLTADPISLRPSCPTPSAGGVHFASHLKDLIPEGIPVQHVDAADKPRRRSSAGYSKPKGRALYTAGRTVASTRLTFGTISGPAEAPPSPLAITTSVPSTPTLSTPAASTPSQLTSPSAVPRVKPSSWAALVRGPKGKPTGTPDSASIPPSSTLVSPSKSILSLPSDATYTPTVTTPGSTTASLPPANGPSRPATFNYAAAAAIGAPLTPAEDLARLLTEGLPSRRGRLPSPVVPRGLINTGNMCFANTILQVLTYCTPFTELFEELGKRLKVDLARRTPLLEAMIIFLREFVPSSSLANGSASASGTSTPRGKTREDAAFIPENVYDAMKENKRFDTMRRGFQEDAEEYLGFFLNTLHEELLAIYSRTQPPQAVATATVANGSAERTIGRPVSPGAGDADDWLEVGKKQKTHVVRAAESRESAVSRVFGGSLRSVLHAPGQKDSVTLEPYQPLQLDIQAPEVNTIADALRHLNEPETVPGVWVAARGAAVDATKQVFLETLPPVLILHLKRFVYDPQEQNVVKKSKPIAYGTELIIPQDVISPPKRAGPVKYRLFGIVYHHGHSATGGHYTVGVARPDGTGWLHFDDETVQPVPVEDLVVSVDEARSGRAGTVAGREKCAYLLFYQRVR